MSEGAGGAPPSRDSSPRAGAAPWWAVSGTTVWASPVWLRPGVPHSDRTSPGGSCPSRAPAGISVSWGWRVSTPAQETPRWAPARGPRRIPGAPSLGQGHGGTDSILHSQANRVCSPAPGTQRWAWLAVGRSSPLPEAPLPTALNATLRGCSRGPAQMWECGLDSV